MAVIATHKPFAAVGLSVVAPTSLTGADSLVYKQGARQVLYLRNEGVGAANITIDGDGVGTFNPGGQGAEINNAAGIVLNVAAGNTASVALVNIRNFLKGTVAVTGGTADVKAWIEES